MENINEIFKLCDELGITTIGQLKAIRQPNKNVLECLQQIRNKRNNYKYDYKMNKILESMDYFECEICGKLTPRKFEGADQNTCADCNPESLGENLTNFKQKDIE